MPAPPCSAPPGPEHGACRLWTHTFLSKKGAVRRATLWKHRARLLLPAAQRSAGPPMLRSPRTGAWGLAFYAVLAGYRRHALEPPAPPAPPALPALPAPGDPGVPPVTFGIGGSLCVCTISVQQSFTQRLHALRKRPALLGRSGPCGPPIVISRMQTLQRVSELLCYMSCSECHHCAGLCIFGISLVHSWF